MIQHPVSDGLTRAGADQHLQVHPMLLSLFFDCPSDFPHLQPSDFPSSKPFGALRHFLMENP